MLRFAEDLMPMMKVLCFNEYSDVKENVMKRKLELDENVSKLDGSIGLLKNLYNNVIHSKLTVV